MNLAFLYPLLGLGALAVAAPVWLHLRRKQQQNLTRFSAVRFLQDQPLPKRSPTQLRNLPLLLLRALALALLAAAFAWPYHRETAGPAIVESRVYILDNTLSHQANNGFTQDRNRLVKELSQARLETQIAVIELTARPRVLAAFGEDRQLVRQKLLELTPSFQRGSYLAAFRQANTLLSQSLGSRKHIVLLGDNQENQWTESTATPPFLQNVEVTLPVISAVTAPNLALGEPSVQRVFLGDKSLVNFTVSLSHQGDARQAVVTLTVNGQGILNRTVDLTGSAESIVLQAQWEADPTLWLRGEITVDGAPDALEADNRVFFAVPPVREGKVALLARSPYLRLALSPDIMKGQWATRVLEPSRLSEEAAAERSEEVLVVEGNFLQSEEARKLVTRWLEAGSGVVLLVNRLSLPLADMLRELGFESQGETTEPTTFQYVYANSPIFHPFISSDFGNLAEVTVRRHARLKSATAIPLAFSQSGDVLLFQGTRNKGKLFVCAFGLDRDQTSWPVHPTFIPFLDLCLQQARAEDTTPVNFEPGDACLINLPGDSPVRDVVLHDGARELSRNPVVNHRAQFAAPLVPGLYAVTYDANPIVEKMISVNPSPKESILKYVATPDALAAWQLPRATQPTKLAEMDPVFRQTLTGILQQPWWWWTMLGAALALSAETIWLTVRRANE
jgi:Aerotolerance regulator N-terminal